MILKSILYNIIHTQQERFFNQKENILRELIEDFKEEKSELIIINGIKRTGKSTFLFQLYKQNYSDAFYINFGHPGLYDFDKNDFFKLDEIIKATGNKTLFFDEVTELNGWQPYVKHKLEEGYKIVLTASNAQIFNDELGLNLTGRYVVKTLQPFSFREFCRFKNLEENEASLENYIKTGGFSFNLTTDTSDYLSQLFDDIVVREIGIRAGVRDLRSFKRLSMYLLQNIGELITGNQLKSQLGIKTTTTVMDYLGFLEAGFLMYYLPKFSYSVRKQQVNPRKVYVVDTGFVCANTFDASEKMDKLLENLVYLKLKKTFTELFYYSDTFLCDFIGFKKGKALEAVQVCANLDQDNLEAEINGLFDAMEFFDFSRGTLVTMSQSDTFVRDGKTIQVTPFFKYDALE